MLICLFHGQRIGGELCFFFVFLRTFLHNKAMTSASNDSPKPMMKVSITPEFQTAYSCIERGENTLVLGSAGTGKSTFLKWVRKKIGSNKKHVVLAPTGMAALQVGGQTIHSFFGFKAQLMQDDTAWHRPRNRKIYEALELIILDEISMVRADIFESIDKFLRRYGPQKGEPFGGVQILALGDVFQLPPVVRRDERDYFQDTFGTAFFWGANAWREGGFQVVEFTEIFRQNDAPFIELLNRVRYGERSGGLLDALNTRLGQGDTEGAVILAARNATVDTINAEEMEKLPADEHIYDAKTTGKVEESVFTSPSHLSLKKGARVMFTRNDALGRWVNGSLGKVISCDEKTVKVKTDEGRLYTVEPVKWEVTKYKLDEDTEAPVAEVAGTFSQLPLTPAWALTIHKAQGQTLEKCVINLSDGGIFAEGQLYVALSRARALESITLTDPITAADIRTSYDVKKFYQQYMRR